MLARRPPDKKLGGLWEFPGGKVEQGESAEAALHRELLEELGCTVRITQTLRALRSRIPLGQHRVDSVSVRAHDRKRRPRTRMSTPALCGWSAGN
jgi:8-oxo-dGTP diphosphatase